MYVSLFCTLRRVSGDVKKWLPAGADRGFTFLEFNLTIAYHRTNLLARYGRWSANSNGALCGAPLEKCKSIESNPTKPGSNSALASLVMPGRNPTVIALSPSSFPVTENPNKTPNSRHQHNTAKISLLALIAIILGDVLVLALVSSLLYCY
ncbi:hypothetical protein F3Y22_tig00110387pilonHSYRG00176 [Hibiscus syriacus]|uniref:Uncharacterized protein n=1 Tax=Hibiscus syriacus TaxID=106335 RepID=A0A6A3ARL5_HIBSY|nr:hypothetical protein F3Y22_tig00110387pilonHSYRG00176 [Hibiscus syriacus]